MSFGTAISTVFGKYAQFEGRASRPEFWWFILFTAVVSAALSALNLGTPDGEIAIGTSLSGVWGAVTLVPTVAVGVRRLRDAGHRWTELLWLLVPIAGLIVAAMRLAEPSTPEEAGHP